MSAAARAIEPATEGDRAERLVAERLRAALPPDHAKRARGSGFCTFNGLALAAKRALAAGARSVLVLDLDAHCGGGTADILADEQPVLHVDVRC